MSDSVYWIWFQLVFGIGSRRAHTLLEYFEDPKQIYDGLAERGRVRLMLREEELGCSDAAMKQAAEIRERTLKKGCEILTPDMDAYPKSLQNIYCKPAALYVKGDLRCLESGLNIALVGTRSYSGYGRQVAEYLAGELAKLGVCVVSGLAKGIDTFCHTAALDNGGDTVGVLGCGIDVDYPKESARVKTRMKERGAVISEYPLGTEPYKSNFPVRNRIISGLSHGTVVVEAGEKSGSVITANHAIEQGREVFAVPGDIFTGRERGSHALIRDGAHLVQHPLDILEVFAGRNDLPDLTLPSREAIPGLLPEEARPQPYETPAEAPARTELPEELGETARAVYARMAEEPRGVEEIAGELTVSVAELQAALTELEIYGLIRGYPGRRFSL